MHEKQHIALLPAILKELGIRHIVISPGSRNAPLIQVFSRCFGQDCINIIDERSAGYFALGIAMSSQLPVVLVSTSGTAAINYAPAVAEAFHQGIPLIVITADRPAEWIDQQDNQTIRQKHIYGQNIKAEFELPVAVSSENDLWYCNRLISEAYVTCIGNRPGPVHINVPLREPLYDTIPAVKDFKLIKASSSMVFMGDAEVETKLSVAKRIVVVAGQHWPDNDLQKAIQQLSRFSQLVVFAEAVSNLTENTHLVNADLVLAQTNLEENLHPDLVIYFGGQVVSKRVKTYLRSLKNTEFWFVSPEAKPVDTFQGLSRIIHTQPALFFTYLAEHLQNIQTDFQNHWKNLHEQVSDKYKEIIESTAYSDILAINRISSFLQADDILFAGNSSAIRFLQYNSIKCCEVYANRGTSGIDGCLSTAAGVAYTSDKNVFVVLGDLSFVYDSNALWNKRLPKNLKIIVINNQGGGIFGLLDGPSSQEAYSEHFITNHPVDIQKLCEAFGVIHYACSKIEELEQLFAVFKDEKTTALLEIHTPGDKNPTIFRNFINNLKA